MLGEAEKVDPRVKRTRQLLQKAMMELVREKSPENITVQDIAARAEVNRATFYAHFEDKNALMNYMAREMFQARLEGNLPAEPTLTHDSLRVLIVTTCDYLGEFMGHCTPVRQWNEQAIMVMQVQAHLCEMLQNWMQKSGVPAPETAALSTSWAIWGSVFQWARNGRKTPMAQFTEQLLAALEGGLHPYLNAEVRA
jgi:AcrR family transcriptional regulator